MARYELERAKDYVEPRGIVKMQLNGVLTGSNLGYVEVDLGPPVMHKKGERGTFATKAEARKAVRSGEWLNVHGYRL